MSRPEEEKPELPALPDGPLENCQKVIQWLEQNDLLKKPEMAPASRLRLVEGEITFEIRSKGADQEGQEKPPANAELLLYLLMSPADCDALVGDLDERYTKLLKRLGKTRADIWYVKQVLTSVWPLLEDSARRLSRSTVVNILCFVLRTCGLGNIAGDLKQVSGRKRK